MKRHSKGHVSSFNYSYRVESGGAWKTMQLLRHTGPKKSTHVIRLNDISLFCAESWLTSWFLTNCSVNTLFTYLN